MKTGPNSNVFAILIAVAAVFGTGINYLAYSRVSANEATLQNLKSQVESVSKMPARYQASTQKLADAQASIKHLEQGVSATNYVPTMMRQLEDLGNSCGVQVTAVRPVPAVAPSPSSKDKPAPQKPYDTLDIEVKGLAHYAQAYQFVSALNRFPKVVEARTVSLEPVAHTDPKAVVGSPKLAVSILIRAYLFKGDNRTALNMEDVNNAG